MGNPSRNHHQNIRFYLFAVVERSDRAPVALPTGLLNFATYSDLDALLFENLLDNLSDLRIFGR